MSTPASGHNNQDGHAFLQMLLDAPQLTQYYHFDERPERLPLQVVNGSAMDFGKATLTAGGRPAVLASRHDRNAFEITAFDMAGDSATLKFRYPVEGLVGHATYKKTKDHWSLDEVDVAEAD